MSTIRVIVLGAVAIASLGLAGCATTPSSRNLAADPKADRYGIVKVKSALPFPDTVERLKSDVAAKGITFFGEVDQQALAAKSDIATGPSTLLMFGNPALGTQFITSNPQSGIDWPVRLLVFEDNRGQVWAEYTDFTYIASRHGITERDAQFAMASKVIESITSSVAE